jgi:hypothetical protein
MGVGVAVDGEMVGSGTLCSQRMLLAACEALERACIVSEGCLLEGSGTPSEVLSKNCTEDEEGGHGAAYQFLVQNTDSTCCNVQL